MNGTDLERLRFEARKLAVEMVRLLALRRDVVAKIASIEHSQGLDVHRPAVEESLRQAMLEEAAKHQIPEQTINRLATIILADSVEMRSKSKPQLTHIDIMRRAIELQKNGREVQRLEVGEPDLGAPAMVRQAVAESVIKGYARYVDPRGIPELRAAISEYIWERYGVEVKPLNIIVTPGGRFAIYLAMKTILAEGDEVLIIDPSWPMYRQCAGFVGARSVHVRTRLENGWTPSLKDVEEKITKATKALLLNYPNNPTGKIIDRKTFSQLLNLAKEYNLKVISDEVYSDYTNNGHLSVLDHEDVNYVLIQSFSKSYGMTGYRIGYIVADESTISRMASVLGLVMTCVPEFIQHGALKALSLKDTPRKYAEIIMKRMDIAVGELEKIGAAFYKPDGGMYVFPKINMGGVDSMKFALDLLESKGVSVAPGSIFGGYDDFIRISLCAPEETIKKGIRLLGEYLSEKGLA